MGSMWKSQADCLIVLKIRYVEINANHSLAKKLKKGSHF